MKRISSFGFLSSVVMLLCAFSTNASALEEVARLVDIDEAVKHTLLHNPGLHAVRQQVVAADENKTAKSAAKLPTLSISHTARVSDNPLDAFADKLFTQQVSAADLSPAALNDPGSSDLYLTQLSLRWPVYAGGKISAQREQAEHSYMGSTQLLQREKQQAAYKTMQAYLYVMAAEEAISISTDALSTAEETAATTAKLAREGRIVESDKLAAEVTLSAVKAQYEQSQTRLKHANNRLKLYMGVPDSVVFNIEKKWPAIQLINQDIENLQSEALANRYDLQAARSTALAAEANVDVVSAVNKPTVDVVANSNWYDDAPGFESQSGSLMAIASFNLYDGTKQGSIGSARALQKEQQWHVLELEQAIRSQVQLAYDDLTEANKRFALAQANISIAKKAVKLVKQRYGQGRTILLDLLQSQRMYTDARIEKLTAKLNRQVSQLALPLAVGTLELPAEK